MSERTAAAEAIRRRAFRLRASPVLWVVGVIFLACWSAALLVLLVDPLDLYPWGAHVKLRDVTYAKGGIPYILEAAIKDKKNDAFVIGGSTSVGFTRDMLDTLLPRVHHAFNLSYGAPRPYDQVLVEKMVARRAEDAVARPKRVILSLDWIHLLTKPAAMRLTEESPFPRYLYDDDPFNDVRMVGGTTLSLAIDALRSRPLWRSGWNASVDARSNARDFHKFQSAKTMAKLTSAIVRHRGDIDEPTTKSCASFFTISDQIVPFARSLSAAGVPLDIVFPPYSLSYYYKWRDNPSGRHLLGTTILEDELLFRKCLVNAIVGIRGVDVETFDNTPDIVSDLGNYRETAHVENEKVYRYILSAIANNTHRLSPQNVDSKNAQLRSLVRNYQIKNSFNGTYHGN